MASKQITRLGKAPEEGIKAPVSVASIGNIPLTGLPEISGVQLVAGDRVLVREQTDATQNGIYCAFVGNWDRASDWNKSNDVINGQLVVDANSTVIWATNTTTPFEINVSEVSFTYTDLAGAANYIHKNNGNNTMLQPLDMNDEYIKDGKVKTNEITASEDIVNNIHMTETIDARMSSAPEFDPDNFQDYGLVTQSVSDSNDYGSI